MHRFYIAFTVVAIGLAVVFSGLTTGSVNSEALDNTAVQTTKAMPNLSGEKAEEYLKEQGLYKSLGEAIAASRYSIYPTKNAPLPFYKESFEANNPRQAFATYFAKDGIHIVSKAENNKWRVQMNLTGYGYGDDIADVEQTETNVQKDKSRIEITKSTTVQSPKSKITEWYENSSSGLEQGWTINERVANVENAELKLVLELGGDLKAKIAADNQAINFIDEKGSPVLRYDKLKSWDADGKVLTSRMDLNGNQLAIVVDDKEAKYPITVDPFFAETRQLLPSDPAADDEFGFSVGISGDTAIVAAPKNDDDGTISGSAYIFERNTNGSDIWGEVQKITASDASSSDEFGYSVAISGDTAIVGARGTGSFNGSAYIFERNTGGTDNWGEVQILTASDTASLDFFGFDVSISGDTAIVGAYGNDDVPNQSGSAYIFERNTGGANNWGEVKKLTASDAAGSDTFGGSVAISGDTAIVGASGNDDDGILSGSAYIFERNTGGANMWGEVKKLTASDAISNQQFGLSVAISDDTAIVGGLNYNRAYIFERNTGGANMWGEVKILIPSDAAFDDRFGRSVAISGDKVIVGAPLNDDDGTNSGSAYIFERNTGGANMWGEVQKITSADSTANDEFGGSVAISDDFAIAGARFYDDGGSNSGSANVFTNKDNNWQQVKIRTSPDGEANDEFGGAVAISNDTVIVGAKFDGGNVDDGSAYIFERNGGGADNWGIVQKITASDADTDDQFGEAVAISGDTVIVGAYLNDDAGGASGSAYIFERNDGGANNWGEVRKLIASDADGGDFFGDTVAISGDTVIVGASGNDDGGVSSGSAYIFVRNEGGADNWGELKILTASIADPLDRFGFSVSISGDKAIVGSPFDDDVSTDSGAAFVFERNSGGAENWGIVKKIIGSGAGFSDNFGNSVAISGNTAIVGQPGGNNFERGAYIFKRNIGGADNWGEVTRLFPADSTSNDRLAENVAISNDVAVVSARLGDTNAIDSGAAYVFKRNTGGVDNWGLVKKLTASNASTGDNFGISISISSGTVIVGANLIDVPALSGKSFRNSTETSRKTQANLVGTDQGAFYIFKALPAPTAANATISGRVLTLNGRGIPNSLVNFTDADGDIRTARTNQFGYFRFDNVEVGQTYVFQVSAKGYLFAPQVINVDDSINGLNFSPLSKGQIQTEVKEDANNMLGTKMK